MNGAATAPVPVRPVTVAERRARLARRCAARPGARAASVLEATEAVVALHATEAATVYLSLAARVEGLRLDDVDRALYVDRSLVRQLAMRRTLFAFPRQLLPAALASVSARVAADQRRLVQRDVEQAGLGDDGAAWLTAAEQAVVGALAGGRAATATELRDELAELRGTLRYGEGRRWSGEAPFAPRVLTTMAAAGVIVRAKNRGPWRTSRPAYALMADWLGEEPARWDPAHGHDELVRRWLARFGPGTVGDLKWWLGSTVGAVRTSLTALGAVPVDLDGAVGYVLADDVEPVAPVEPWAALLPVLDATTMGWQGRDWYLGEHAPHLVDGGNAGPTAWWDGRIVGGWHQDRDATVVVVTLEDVGAEAEAALATEAARLTAWLQGVRIGTVYPSPLMRAHRT